MDTRIDGNRKAAATVSLGIVIAIPIINPKGDAVWQVSSVDNTYFIVMLDGYEAQDLTRQVKEVVERFKQQWPDRVISTTSWQPDAEPILSKMVENLS